MRSSFFKLSNRLLMIAKAVRKSFVSIQLLFTKSMMQHYCSCCKSYVQIARQASINQCQATVLILFVSKIGTHDLDAKHDLRSVLLILAFWHRHNYLGEQQLQQPYPSPFRTRRGSRFGLLNALFGRSTTEGILTGRLNALFDRGMAGQRNVLLYLTWTFDRTLVLLIKSSTIVVVMNGSSLKCRENK